MFASIAYSVTMFLAPNFATDQVTAFDAAPMSSAELGAVHGTGLFQPKRDFTKSMSQTDAVTFSRQTSEEGRIANDLWWSEPGAALVFNAVLQNRSIGN